MARYDFWDMPIGSGLKAQRPDVFKTPISYHSFESSKLGTDGWIPNSGTFTRTTEDKRTGTYSGKLSGGSYITRDVYTNTRILPGIIQIQVYMKAISTNATVKITYVSEEVEYVMIESASVSKDSWTFVWVSATLENYTSGGYVKIERTDHSSYGFYMDDIELGFIHISGGNCTLCKRGSSDEEDKGTNHSNWFKFNLPDMTWLPDDLSVKCVHIMTHFYCLGSPSEIPHVMATSQDTSWTTSSSISVLKGLELDPELEYKRAILIPNYSTSNTYNFYFDISSAALKKYQDNDWGACSITTRWFRLDISRDGDSYLFNKDALLGSNDFGGGGYSIAGTGNWLTAPQIRVVYDRLRTGD